MCVQCILCWTLNQRSDTDVSLTTVLTTRCSFSREENQSSWTWPFNPWSALGLICADPVAADDSDYCTIVKGDAQCERLLVGIWCTHTRPSWLHNKMLKDGKHILRIRQRYSLSVSLMSHLYLFGLYPLFPSLFFISLSELLNINAAVN